MNKSRTGILQNILDWILNRIAVENGKKHNVHVRGLHESP